MALIVDGRAGGTNHAGVDAYNRLFTGLYDPAGNPISSSNPLPMSLIGAISGTVTANIGTTGGLALDATLQSIIGAGATPGTAAAKSHLMGGVYQSTPPTATAGQQVALLVDSAGRPIVNVNSLPSLPAGSNQIGSVAQAGTWAVTLSAGAASIGSVSVSNFPGIQPVSASALPLPTGAATSANQATEITALQQIVSNTGASSVDFVQTGTITAAGQAVTVTGQGCYSTTISVTGTWSANLVVEGQAADGTWYQLPAFALLASLPYAPTFNITTNGLYVVIGGGFLNIRLRATTYASGTVNVGEDSSLSQQATYAAQLGNWLVRMQDGAGNALASSVAAPVGTEQALIVRAMAHAMDGVRATYSAAVAALAAAGSTDVFSLYGSASKTVRLTRLVISGTQTTAGARDVVLLRRSTANAAGTLTNPTAVAHDSNSSAASAVVSAYTASPTTLGTLLGNIRARKLTLATTTSTGASDEIIWEFGNRPSQAVVLRGATQGVCVNFNGTATTGGAFDIGIEWTEDAS